MRLHHLARIDPTEIIVPFTNDEIKKLWEDNVPWQRVWTNFLGEINENYPKSDRISLINRGDCILPHIVCDTPITGAPTFYTDVNKSEKA